MHCNGYALKTVIIGQTVTWNGVDFVNLFWQSNPEEQTSEIFYLKGGIIHYFTTLTYNMLGIRFWFQWRDRICNWLQRKVLLTIQLSPHKLRLCPTSHNSSCRAISQDKIVYMEHPYHSIICLAASHQHCWWHDCQILKQCSSMYDTACWGE